MLKFIMTQIYRYVWLSGPECTSLTREEATAEKRKQWQEKVRWIVDYIEEDNIQFIYEPDWELMLNTDIRGISVQGIIYTIKQIPEEIAESLGVNRTFEKEWFEVIHELAVAANIPVKWNHKQTQFQRISFSDESQLRSQIKDLADQGWSLFPLCGKTNTGDWVVQIHRVPENS